ncbi:hypothetical protein BDV34DRAFT_187908 [Aspergillus parasiticus]|uniref:Uncharacterized protein n=2 Tax=Aspergillus subgen. Circumdati TaxID=2720871 RepID=A0A5N6DZA2_ASPPA|nr:hypothetical protein BDV34DRAFT_187908 [Aspergillus parasiticus]KAE8319321.1 hypothetical protein BDV41DRAFT_519620 [Aspergillus transmontanensis]
MKFCHSINSPSNSQRAGQERGMQGRDATIAWIVISFIPSPACCIHSRINPGGRKELIGNEHRRSFIIAPIAIRDKNTNIVNY